MEGVMRVRQATASDAAEVTRIFYDTIHRVNARDYSPEQLRAWAPRQPDPLVWAENRLTTRMTFVAEDRGAVLGFAELDRRGLIDCFYCHHNHQRCGIGSLILSAIEGTAISLGLSRLTTASSITARPFFVAHGFVAVKAQTVTRRNIELPNFMMEKNLSRQTSSNSLEEAQFSINCSHNRT
jgi:putative acetyltransferase